MKNFLHIIYKLFFTLNDGILGITALIPIIPPVPTLELSNNDDKDNRLSTKGFIVSEVGLEV